MAEAFAQVLGTVVAEKEREFNQIIAIRDAEAKAFQAQLAATVRAALDEITAKLSTIRDGEQGPAGPPGPTGPVGEAGAPGLAGPPGPPGPAGPEGAMGPAGLTGEKGERGEKGEAGWQGEQGPEGMMGPAGLPGRDGMPGRDGLHGLQGERGPAGKDGRDGVDGKDGAGFEDWMVDYDGHRSVVLSCGAGERRKSFTLVLPIPIYCGKWEAGKYQRGDEVTNGGQVFRAMRDTDEKPGLACKDWLAAVSRGRDGRDGKDGERGPQGPEGKPGRDLTQLGPDGKKW